MLRFIQLLLCLVPIVASAQSVKLQVVVSEAVTNAPIASAIVTSYDNNGKQLGYHLTNTSGVADLTLFPQVHTIKIRKMGYKEREVALSDIHKGILRITLEEKTELLPEFVFRIPAIERKSDTIVYNASSFISTQDTYLRDLLEKLPGVRINESGIVYYQGEPIKRFYIEGKDLLGSQYAQATNNLSADAVSKVEVLEHHQDVKILQGIVPEERSSMNIILKDSYKVRPFGYLEGGMGYKPALYEAKANATKISKSPLQYYIYGSVDNYNAENADASLSLNVSELNSLIPQKGKLSSTGIGGKPIGAKYYASNKSWQASANGLLSFSEDAQLRINVKGNNDWIGAEEQQREHYKELDVRLEERSKNQTNQMGFKPIIVYELNSKQIHLSNKLMSDIGRNKGFRHVVGDRRELRYTPESRYWWMQNNLNTTFPISSERSHLGNFYSKVLYGETTDHLGIDKLDHPLFQSEWQASHGFSADFTLPISARLDLSVDDHFYYRRYQVDRLETRVLHNELEVSPRVSLPFDRKRGHLSVGVDLQHTLQNISEVATHLWALSPNLRLSYKGKNGWEYLLSSSYRNHLPLASSYFPMAYSLSHRVQSIDYLKSYRTRQWNTYAKLTYSDIINYVFATLNLRYTNTWSPIVRDISLSSDAATIISSSLHKGHSQSVTSEIKLDKSFSDYGVNIIFDGSINLASIPSSLNKNVTQGYYHNYMAQLELVYTQIEWLTLSGKLSYNYGQAKRGERDGWNRSTQIRGDISALFSLSKQMSLAWNYEWSHFSQELNRTLPDFHLMSLSLDWKASKKLKFLVECNNLLNSNDYIIRTNTPIEERTNLLQLRPRSIFLKLHWSY